MMHNTPHSNAMTGPLALVRPGCPVRLAAVDGGNELRTRLASMGLITGVELEVISGSLNGPLVIAIDQTRIMLGRGMAHRVRVIGA